MCPTITKRWRPWRAARVLLNSHPRWRRDGYVRSEATDWPMHDYDADYRRLRAAGLQGWAGDQHERNLARLSATLEGLERDHFPRPPAKVLELGCGNGMSSSQWMARRGYEVHGTDISEVAIAWAGEAFAENGL